MWVQGAVQSGGKLYKGLHDDHIAIQYYTAADRSGCYTSARFAVVLVVRCSAIITVRHLIKEGKKKIIIIIIT